jgi:DNA replication protein DnaC
MTDPSRLGDTAADFVQGLADQGVIGRVAETPAMNAPQTETYPQQPDPAALVKQNLIQEGLRRIPPRFLRSQPTPEVAEWVHQIKTAWADTRSTQGCHSLVLLGPTGTGKTEQFWVSYRALLTEMFAPLVQQSRMVNMVEVFTDLRPSSGVDAGRLMDELKTAPILWADDIASAVLSEFERRELYRIIDYRYQWMLPVMVSSNLPARKDTAHPEIPTFAEAVGDRVASRLRGMGRLVPLVGQDRRGGE